MPFSQAPARRRRAQGDATHGLGRLPRAVAFALLPMLVVLGCSKPPADELGVVEEHLRNCPEKVDCVCSDALAVVHATRAFHLAGSAADGWGTARRLVAAMPGATIVKEEANYLHAEVRGRLFGPVDDLELHLRVEPRVIAVRSLSRSEWSRAGSNRARVESLRDGLRKAGQLDEEFGISGD